MANASGQWRNAMVGFLLAVALAVPSRGRAEDVHGKEGSDQPPDLGILDFFSAGWDVPEAHPSRTTRDMALLRVEAAYVEKEFRVDLVHTNYRGDTPYSGGYLTKASLAYAVNRRLQIEVSGLYAWNVIPGEPPANGGGASASLRFQLVDTVPSSYAFQVEVESPVRGFGENRTAMAYSVAGFQDVSTWLPALGPVGLYYSLKWENLLGPADAGDERNALVWDVSVARTWTAPDTPIVGTFTTFLEAWMATALDGDAAGKLNFALTPGVRFWFLPENSLILGVDIPLNSGAPYSATWRATYFLGF
jgi:hypothetical protein